MNVGVVFAIPTLLFSNVIVGKVFPFLSCLFGFSSQERASCAIGPEFESRRGCPAAIA